MSNAIQSILAPGSGGVIVEAECHLSNGLPTMVIVGLGNKAVDEAKGVGDAVTSMMQGIGGAICGAVRDTCKRDFDGSACQAALTRYK